MTEQREQCCGNCKWFIENASGKDGWCGLTELYILPCEGCSRWEEDKCQDDHDEEEADNDA